MADTKQATKAAPARPARSLEVLQKLTVLEYGSLTNEEAKILRAAMAEQDKKRKAADPSAKGILPDRSYEKQPMDEMVDALGSLINGTDDVPSSYNKLSKEEAVQLRDALVRVVKLGKKMIVKGHIFDLRFDQRGHGWAKLTENWRKDEATGKNEMQEVFDSYKGNDTVEIFKG